MRLLVALALCLAMGPVFAVEPDEILVDTELEERARNISKNLRCLVCQNESIDESNAPLARDLRILVREMIASGSDDRQIYRFIEDRYGEFALFRPRAEGSNLILYLAGPAMFVIAAATGVLYVNGRRRRKPDRIEELSESEEARLSKLLDDGNDRA